MMVTSLVGPEKGLEEAGGRVSEYFHAKSKKVKQAKHESEHHLSLIKHSLLVVADKKRKLI